MRAPAKGLTLIELLTAVAVLAVLATLGLPALQDAAQRWRGAAALHHLSGSFALARSAAVARGHPVSVCPATPEGRCGGGRDWSGGWLVYADRARRDQPAGPEDVLRRHRGEAGIAVHTSAGRQRVRFQPDGRAGGSNLSLHVCADGALLGQIVVNNGGRARSQRPAGPTPCPGAP